MYHTFSDCWRAGGKCSVFSFLPSQNLSAGRTVVMKHFCQATFFCSFFFRCCLHVLDTTSQPAFLAPYCAPNFSSCYTRKVTSLQLCWEGCQHYQRNQGPEHSLVSSLNDYEKQLRHWSHQFKDWGMSTAATNTWVAFLCHSKSLESRWKIINIKLNVDKNIFQLKNYNLNMCWK